ncbi:arsenate reductase (azurin) large subunit [Mesorhizobium sp.]|uniref:arsenate reductase (azurin) large subunit n=1 Tax=Mesorhizobium sp. TaxID=1871066 RepID=UPI000FE58767|nr:arsenate reductase (azurin) large subunit [Mesorhizobium sp.]RWI17277.1 MAG: arsenate reductase (azurin) large subunit [Mesorhizobium sp.]RWK49983.1 MAG: arsenate reductase (azurin) large subunit [Mesorhizobium sp.]RWK93999.1 MAG: arsenate reductase (azurin) large subunit [Mesorhizobium sp.]RWL10342.1 MAG: arsenate reductase (azurin) large subunit [Mesorhizobium sp.]TIP58575.1 MAG: arsenate reductase (azurin) large subunit [Mesorhizobium sp.]
MAYKRQIGRLPIIPADAKVHNVVCHYCIVGCGYHAYTWDANHQGGTAPDQNVFGVDLSHQQEAETPAWYSPSMYNIVKQDGKDVHIVIKPDRDCVVNSGLGSIRGARMAEMSFSRQRNTQLQRLTDPMVWRYGQMQPTSWDDALDLVARVTAAVIKEQGDDGVFVSAFDHGGAGGGYENTWGTGKLYFGAMKVKNIRIHNRPAYNSEVHATRDMGVGELNNCYEDAELADTIMVVGANPLETQTNYFLNHWIPNLRGTSTEKKNKELPGEPHEPVRVIIVDPRRTVTVNACEVEAGKERVLHLAINSGTDLALFNALVTHIADQGWTDKDFIAASTNGFDKALAANRTTLEQAAEITGLTVDQIKQAAAWIAEPKDGKRRRTMFAYEKGLIWGNDNYRTNGSLVNLALATGNIGRPGGGCVRLGGHQEGYSRPSDAHVGRPAAYVDRLLIEGKGGVHHIWGCDHYKTTLNAHQFKRRYKERTDMVKDAMSSVPYGDRQATVDAIVGAVGKGGLFSVDVDIIPTKIGQASHVWLPAATSGEMNLTSMNGERRMRLTERYMDPPGQSMPDCLIAARLANHLERVFREAGDNAAADQFKGFDWQTEEDAFMDGYHQHEKGGEFVTYARLRAMGTNGFQEPATGLGETEPLAAGTSTGEPGEVLGGPAIEGARGKQPVQKAAPTNAGSPPEPAAGTERIIGTKRLYADGKFNKEDGKAVFAETQWRGLQAAGKQEEKDKFSFLINNGRTNHVWQSAYLDQQNELVMDRWPYPFIEMNPADMAELSLNQGDLVEVYNDNGATQAAVYPTPTAKRKETFMLFAFPTGVQGNVVSPGVNEFIIPNYKQTWANIRKISDAPEGVKHLSFKSQEYQPV